MGKRKEVDADLMQEAVDKLYTLNTEEVKNFLKINLCPHKHTSKCGMDRICDDCGDWA
jgi:hypothetical protein